MVLFASFVVFFFSGTRVGGQCLQRLEGEAYHSPSFAARHPWWWGVGLPHQGNNCWRRWAGSFPNRNLLIYLLIDWLSSLYVRHILFSAAVICSLCLLYSVEILFCHSQLLLHQTFGLTNVFFCFQVSFPTSTNPSLGRRASRRLHRCHVDQKFRGLGFDRTRSSHLFFFINIIAKEEWLLGFVL